MIFSTALSFKFEPDRKTLVLAANTKRNLGFEVSHQLETPMIFKFHTKK